MLDAPARRNLIYVLPALLVYALFVFLPIIAAVAISFTSWNGISRPIIVGYTIHPGDQLQSEGNAYGTAQIVENYFNLSSTGQGSAIQATKMVTADVGIYPQQLRIPQ